MLRHMQEARLAAKDPAKQTLPSQSSSVWMRPEEHHAVMSAPTEELRERLSLGEKFQPLPSFVNEARRDAWSSRR
jgi:hypothetical protein